MFEAGSGDIYDESLWWLQRLSIVVQADEGISTVAVRERGPFGDSGGDLIREFWPESGSAGLVLTATLKQAGQSILVHQLPVLMIAKETDGRLILPSVDKHKVRLSDVQGLLLTDGSRFGDSIASGVSGPEEQVEVPVDDLHGIAGIIATIECNG